MIARLGRKGFEMSNRWYGSLMNRVAEMAKQPKPEVGMFCTELQYSDRAPYEITRVIDDRHIMVRALGWLRVDGNGMSESQDYRYFSRPDAPERKVFLTKSGKWRLKSSTGVLGNTFALGYAERYFDFSF